MTTLRDAIAVAMIAHISDDPEWRENQWTYNKFHFSVLADAVMIALRNYPPSAAMCEVWSDLHPTKGLATEWYYMIQAAIYEAEILP